MRWGGGGGTISASILRVVHKTLILTFMISKILGGGGGGHVHSPTPRSLVYLQLNISCTSKRERVPFSLVDEAVLASCFAFVFK